MKTKMVLVILTVVCAGLAVALIAAKMNTSEELEHTQAATLDLSNQLVAATDHANDLQQVNLALTNSFIAHQRQIATLSNNLTRVSSALASARATLQGAQDQIANLNGRVPAT